MAWNIPHHSKVKISKRSIPSSNKVSWVRISMEKPYLQQLSQRALQTLQSLKNKCFKNRTFALDFISQIFNYLFFNHFFYQNNTNTPSNFLHVPTYYSSTKLKSPNILLFRSQIFILISNHKNTLNFIFLNVNKQKIKK